MDPKLPDSTKPNVVISGNGLFNQLKRPVIFVPVFVIALVLLTGFGFYLWQQKVKPEIPTPQASQNVIILKDEVLTPPNEKQKGPFVCPGISAFCKLGKDIFISSSYIGFGNKLTRNNPIYAAFDGYFEATSAAIANPSKGAKSQNIIIGILTDKENLLRAHYYFTGPLPKNRDVNVKAGDIIAYSGQENMPLYQNTSLVFVLTRNDSVMGKRLGGERVKLTSRDFK